jgi:hypothetical protein
VKISFRVTVLFEPKIFAYGPTEESDEAHHKEDFSPHENFFADKRFNVHDPLPFTWVETKEVIAASTIHDQ